LNFTRELSGPSPNPLKRFLKELGRGSAGSSPASPLLAEQVQLQ
jgi:hypothetical protein